MINSGDVIVSLTRPNLNAVALVPSELNQQIASTGFEVLRPEGIQSELLFSLVKTRSLIDSISGKVQGALYPAAKSKDVRDFEFPLPPAEEQKQIAVKLDELLARVDSIKARLDAIPAILKRFRQSVLAAAVSGRLTEDWRKQNLATKPTDSWPTLERISLPTVEIPDTWEGVSLGSVAERVSVGHVGKTSEFYTNQGDGVAFLRSQNVRPGRVSKEGLAFITEAFHATLKKSQLKPGDLLVVRVGANRGDACVLPDLFDKVNCANIVFARPREGLSRYLNVYFQSPLAQELLLGQTVGGAQGVINTRSVASTFLALPPIEEQSEIVRRVDELLARSDRLAENLVAAETRANRLTQSVLAKAFRGELTAEWRQQNTDLITAENSAQALLERIRAQQASAKTATRRRGRSPARSKGAKSSMIVSIIDALERKGEPLNAQSLLAEAGYAKMPVPMTSSGSCWTFVLCWKLERSARSVWGIRMCFRWWIEG